MNQNGNLEKPHFIMFFTRRCEEKNRSGKASLRIDHRNDSKREQFRITLILYLQQKDISFSAYRGQFKRFCQDRICGQRYCLAAGHIIFNLLHCTDAIKLK